MTELVSDKTRNDLLNEIESDIARYRQYRKNSSKLRWFVLLMITVSGFFTAAAGGAGSGQIINTWFSTPNMLTVWGLVAAIGSLVVQTANPAGLAETFEKKKDAMRALRTELKYRDLDIKVAARLMETARTDPEKAMDTLASIQNG